MDSRSQFEKWMIGMYDTRLLRQGENYMGSTVQKLWEAWQESRAAIEVSLPGKVSKLNATDSGFVLPEAENYDEAIDDCAEAIRVCGISI